MSTLGSVFLGDASVQKRRHLLGSTPPSSPPLVSGFDSSITSMTVPSSDKLAPVLESVDGTESPAKTTPSSLAEGRDPTHTGPTTIDPVLSLELRLRWLEALLIGVRQDARDRKGRDKPELKPGETLLHLAADVQRRLTTIVESNDSLKKFMHQYDQHAQLLTPAFALSGTLPPGVAPTYDSMSPDELDALLTEMEPDVRAADRDMREIELLEQSGVLSAGKLADCQTLQPRLHALLEAQEQDMRLAAALEKRIAALVERHATHVDTLSELFVAWDDVLTETESKIKRLERDKEERQRLGYA